jgi:hypothetical protein
MAAEKDTAKPRDVEKILARLQAALKKRPVDVPGQLPLPGVKASKR